MRKTFIIGTDGSIKHQWDTVDVKKHAEEVLAVIRGGGKLNPRGNNHKKSGENTALYNN
jgi:hypothetical protein